MSELSYLVYLLVDDTLAVSSTSQAAMDRWPSMEDTTRILNSILEEMGFTRDENDFIRKSL